MELRQQPSKQRFGTTGVSGLNVGSASHLIRDDELVESLGGWTEQDMVWKSQRSHATIHEASAISAFAPGRMGSAEHNVYMDGNTLYDTGSSVGTITAGSTMRIFPVDDSFLVLGASDGKNRVYDGDAVREQGTWQPDYIHTPNETGTGSPGGGLTITGITLGEDETIISFAANDFRDGDRVYVTGITTGPTALNGRYFTVYDAVFGVAGSITISADTDGLTAWSAGGTVNGQTDLAGTFKWYMTTTIELEDGSILESRPRGLLIEETITSAGFPREHYRLGPEDQYDASELIISPGAYVSAGNVGVSNPGDCFRVFFAYGGSNLYEHSGTAGTDYERGVRIYRTKEGGTDFYLEREYTEDDDEVTTFSDATGSGLSIGRMYLGIPDIDLGAVYTAEPYDHDVPPTSLLAAQVGQRVFLNDEDNPYWVYWSHLDGTGYYNDTNYVALPDVVTALYSYRDRLIVWSAQRLWILDMVSGLPVVKEIDTPTGTIYPDAICSSDEGLFWVKPRGIYHFDLVRVEKISRRGIEDRFLDTPYSAYVGDDTAIFITIDGSALARIRDGGWYWHKERSALTHKWIGQNSVGDIIAAKPTAVEKLFGGTTYGGYLESKTFTDGFTWRPTRMFVDLQIAPGATATARLDTNRADGSAQDCTPTANNRRQIIEVSLNREPAEQFTINVNATGEVSVYGYWIEVEK